MAWDTLYTLDLKEGRARPVELSLHGKEDERDRYEMKKIDREISEAALSPDGEVMAFVAYGEIFVRNLEDKSPTRQVTHSHAREEEIAWSPDWTPVRGFQRPPAFGGVKGPLEFQRPLHSKEAANPKRLFAHGP